MAQPWPQPCKLTTEHLTVLSAAPGTRSHHQLFLSCTVASNPTPATAKLVAGDDSGHPEPNYHHQTLRLVPSYP